MASGTTIRLILGLICIIAPTIAGLFYNPVLFIFYTLDIVLIPALIMWDNVCDCEDCFLSSTCNKTKRFNLIKWWLKFIGYDNGKLEQIPFPKNYECKNTYKDIYSYIKKTYESL